MRNTPTKADNIGDVLPAANFNAINNELENLITSCGGTLDPDGGPDSSLIMIAEAIVTAASSSWRYADSGAVNTYVLSRVAGSTIEEIPAYYDGMAVSFTLANTNTGPSTVNVSTLGAKDLYYRGAALVSGVLVAGETCVAFYDLANDRFNISIAGMTVSALKDHTLAIHEALGLAPLASPALTGNPTAPTQAAGNDTTRLATTAFVQAALGLSVFQSAAFTITASTIHTFAHGLGAVPKRVWLAAKCKTTEHGYAVNDWAFDLALFDNSLTVGPVNVRANTTNVYFAAGDSTLKVISQVASAAADWQNITPANWDLHIFASLN